MDIDFLRTFAAICDLGSFTAAARQVGRTQSAVSLQIRRIEEQLGRPLFARSSGAVTLSPHGESFLNTARRIIATYDEALATFSRDSITGTVVLGFPEDYAPRIMNIGLAGFSDLYPMATVDLVLDQSKTLSSALVEGSVDLAFLTAGEGIPHRGEDVFSDRVVWVAPRNGALHQRDPLPIAIWREDDSYASMMVGALKAMNRPYRIAARSRSMTGLRAAVTSGLAITALAESSRTSDMLELSPEMGFPPLPLLAVKLVKGGKRRAPVIDRLAQHLEHLMRVESATTDPPGIRAEADPTLESRQRQPRLHRRAPGSAL